MNQQIAAIAKKASEITSAHDQMHVQDELRALAGDQDVILFLLSEMSRLAGRLVIRPRDDKPRLRLVPRDLEVTLDGMELPPYYKLNLIVDTENVVRAEIGFYPCEVDVDAQTWTLLRLLGANKELES